MAAAAGNKATQRTRTHQLLRWCASIICGIIALAGMITLIVIFFGFMFIRPKIPVIGVAYVGLEMIYYDQAAGTLSVRLSITIKAENDNQNARARFDSTDFTLIFYGVPMAKLAAPDSFEVGKKSFILFDYRVESLQIPVKIPEVELEELSLKRSLITFDLKGKTKTQWRVGSLGSVKFWVHLNCQLQFFPLNLTSTGSPCISKTK